jgi:hypothetical protein
VAGSIIDGEEMLAAHQWLRLGEFPNNGGLWLTTSCAGTPRVARGSCEAG